MSPKMHFCLQFMISSSETLLFCRTLGVGRGTVLCPFFAGSLIGHQLCALLLHKWKANSSFWKHYFSAGIWFWGVLGLVVYFCAPLCFFCLGGGGVFLIFVVVIVVIILLLLLLLFTCACFLLLLLLLLLYCCCVDCLLLLLLLVLLFLLLFSYCSCCFCCCCSPNFCFLLCLLSFCFAFLCSRYPQNAISLHFQRFFFPFFLSHNLFLLNPVFYCFFLPLLRFLLISPLSLLHLFSSLVLLPIRFQTIMFCLSQCFVFVVCLFFFKQQQEAKQEEQNTLAKNKTDLK